MEEKNRELSEEMKRYFDDIDRTLYKNYEYFNEIKKIGIDDDDFVDIKIAENMSERVEELIATFYPQIRNSGVKERIKEIEEKYGALDWRVSLEIAKEVAEEKFCRFDSKKEAIEAGIRVGFAYNTGGIVGAPLEGFIEIKIKERKDKKEYIAAYFAGPIRGAGGTASAFSLVLIDYLRKEFGYSRYDISDKEIQRFIIELKDYNFRVTNLQYMPSDEEIEFLVKNIGIEVSGEPTEKIEVFSNKDLDRVETNRVRGGMCLVIGEGISQKAKKIWKRIDKWGDNYDLEWKFLKDFIDLQDRVKSGRKITEETDSKDKLGDTISPNYTYIKDLVAGRPVFSFPMTSGGFRLRFGRTRISGFSAASINPATMMILEEFIATGTQLKIERPGKSTTITPCETIEGPLVELISGKVIKVNTIAEAKKYKNEINRIIYLGDILFNYGDFSENNHKLVPVGYTEEEWCRELIEKLEKEDVFDDDELESLTGYPKKELNTIFIYNKLGVSLDSALKISKRLNMPLFPKYIFNYNQLSYEDLFRLLDFIKSGKILTQDEEIMLNEYVIDLIELDKDKISDQLKLVLPNIGTLKDILCVLGLEHELVNEEYIILDKENLVALFLSLGYFEALSMFDVTKEDAKDLDSAYEVFCSGKLIKKELGLIDEKMFSSLKVNESILSAVSGYRLMEKSGTFIGARMGRPEKSKMRKSTGASHIIFPVYENGGKLNNLHEAVRKRKIEGKYPIYVCDSCKESSIEPYCAKCDKRKEKKYFCRDCNKIINDKVCDMNKEHYVISKKDQIIDIEKLYNGFLTENNLEDIESIKALKEIKNNFGSIEHIGKGYFRSKHNLFVNKDGTVRIDTTELPMTHFKPSEIGISLEKLKQIGYSKDIYGNDISGVDQIIELRPQDIVLPSPEEDIDDRTENIYVRLANFIDDELIKVYKKEKFYDIKSKEDLIGHQMIVLAPHISVGTVARVIGFSKVNAIFAHPLLHAAIRRDCDGDEMSVLFLADAFLNFSRKFLPDRRGARTMDAPLILSSKVVTSEVDDMVLGLDVAFEYDKGFYEKARRYRYPYEHKIMQVKDKLGKEDEYENYGFTHEVFNINSGIYSSSYKILPTMKDKLDKEMILAEKIRAVDESEVAAMIVNKHFLRDIKGNLRKFFKQQFRCTTCNSKYRRPPLIGNCTKCGGSLMFTVSYGSIIKYLGLSKELTTKYNVSDYLKQDLEILDERIEGIFGKEEEKQKELSEF